MTEQEWVASTDAGKMLQFLMTHGNPKRGAAGTFKPSDRQLRLFACAWWRCFSPHTAHHELILHGIEVLGIWQVWHGSKGEQWTTQDVLIDCQSAACHDAEAGGKGAALLRDIIGNPFQPSLWKLPGSSWLTPTVIPLARAAYGERPAKWVKTPLRDVSTGYYVEDGTLDPVRLAILADALEEAGLTASGCIHCGGGGYVNKNPPCGCASTDVLLHLRGPGPHVRGCWAVDLVLGKE